MNRKQFLTLLIVGLVVGGIGLAYLNKRRSSYTATETSATTRVMPDFPLNDVGQIRIKQAGGEVNLQKTNESWVVQERWGYPANFSEISGFLRKVWELKPVQEVQVGASQFARLELVAPTNASAGSAGTMVEFKDKNNAPLKNLLLGKKHTRGSGEESPFGGGDMPVGRYVMVPEAQPKVWLVSETFADVEPKPEQWLDKEFFKVEKSKAISVVSPQETNTWSVARETETGDWKLLDAKPDEQIDSSKASSLNWALNSPNFNDVAAPDVKLEEVGLDKPVTAKIETFDGFIYNLKISSQTNENLHLQVDVSANFPKERTAKADEKPEDKDKLDKEFKDNLVKLEEKLKKEQKFSKWTYVVSKWTVDALLKPRKDLLAEKKEEPKPEEGAAKPVDSSAPPIEVLPPELKNLPPTPPENEAKKP